MISILFWTLFIISPSFSMCLEDSSTEPVVTEISKMLNQECIKPFNNFQLNDALKNEKDSPKVVEMRKKVCKPCLEKNILKRPDSELAKQRMTKQLISEAKKNLSQTMLSLISIRSFDMEENPTSAKGSCEFNKYEQSIASCLSKPGVEKEIKDFAIAELRKMKEQTRVEFFNLVSPPKNTKTGGLLPRQNNLSCNISEKDILIMETKATEENLLKIIKSLKEKTFVEKDFSQQLIETFNGDLNIRKVQEHPMLKQIFSNAQSLNNFLKTTPQNIDITGFRKKIYVKENSQKFDLEIANRCSNVFKTMESTFCSPEFSEGQIFFDDSQAIRSSTNIKIDTLPSNHEEKNKSLILFCQEFSEPGKKILVSEIQTLMNSDLPRHETFEGLSLSLYDHQLATPGQMLCDKICPNKSDKSCPNTQNGKNSNLLSDDLDKHNDGIDQIFRSLLGNPSRNEYKDDPIMLAAFEKEGIIQDESGQFVTNAPKSNFQDDSTLPNIQPSQLQPGRQIASVKSESTIKAATPTAPASPQIAYPTNPITNTEPLPFSSSASSTDEDEIRTDLQKQILDRLGKQVTAKQIEDMVEKAYNKGRSSKMTKSEIQEKTKEIIEDIPSNLNGNFADGSPVNAKISSDKDKAKKAEQLGFLKAKYGIDPTGNSAKAGLAKAGATNDENLKVVAVTNAEELKIVLGDLDNSKNVEIVELMKKQTPFILQVGKVAYKISFENGQLKIADPKNAGRDPAAISKLKNFILNLVSAKKMKGLYKQLRKVNYQE